MSYHICSIQPDAPHGDGNLGDTWTCSCGKVYIYETNFTEDDHYCSDWWLLSSPAQTAQPNPSWWARLVGALRG